jgi:hypothetical protein
MNTEKVIPDPVALSDPRTRTVRRVATVVAIVTLALSGLIFTRNLIDFPVYYAAGQSLLAGRTDLYSPDFARSAVMDYRYPPLFLLIFTPLWILPYKIAALIWHLIGTAAICAAVGVLNKLARVFNARTSLVWTIAFFGAAQYFIMILHYGNAHLLVTALMIVGFYLALKRDDFTGGALVALAITIKLTPISCNGHRDDGGFELSSLAVLRRYQKHRAAKRMVQSRCRAARVSRDKRPDQPFAERSASSISDSRALSDESGWRHTISRRQHPEYLIGAVRQNLVLFKRIALRAGPGADRGDDKQGIGLQ